MYSEIINIIEQMIKDKEYRTLYDSGYIDGLSKLKEKIELMNTSPVNDLLKDIGL